VTYPFFVGGIGFLAGCYLALVEVVNANLQEELAELRLAGSVHRSREHTLRWWGWQPRSLLYCAAAVQLLGAICFQVGLVASLPGMIEGHAAEVALIFTPSVLGSTAFTFASYVYLAEVTHSFNPLHRPDHLSLGYCVALLNLIGSANFLFASLGYYVEARPWEELANWEYLVSLWAVRFPFMIGSACFAVGAFIGLGEALSN